MVVPVHTPRGLVASLLLTINTHTTSNSSNGLTLRRARWVLRIAVVVAVAARPSWTGKARPLLRLLRRPQQRQQRQRGGGKEGHALSVVVSAAVAVTTTNSSITTPGTETRDPRVMGEEGGAVAAVAEGGGRGVYPTTYRLPSVGRTPHPLPASTLTLCLRLATETDRWAAAAKAGATGGRPCTPLCTPLALTQWRLPMIRHRTTFDRNPLSTWLCATRSKRLCSTAERGVLEGREGFGARLLRG